VEGRVETGICQMRVSGLMAELALGMERACGGWS